MPLFHKIRKFEAFQENLIIEHIMSRHRDDLKIFLLYGMYDIPYNSRLYHTINKEFLKTIVGPIFVAILNDEFKNIKKMCTNKVVVECGDGVKFYISRDDQGDGYMDFKFCLYVDDAKEVYSYRSKNVRKRLFSKFPNCFYRKDIKEETKKEIMRNLIRFLLDSKL